MEKQETGKIGEKIAGRYLEAKGYRILRVSQRFRFAEIDIVALKSKMLVFVEVKTLRQESGVGNPYRKPEDNITSLKRVTLRRAAVHYANQIYREEGHLTSFRIDVVAVVLSKKEAVVRHYRNALAM